MKKNRKGFTQFELVVVMVVVLIVLLTSAITYINLIKKAKLSADASFVRSANQVIATSDTKVFSADEAIRLVFANGYNENSLFAKKDTEHFAYDTENNKFMLLDDQGKVIYSESKTKAKNYEIIVIDENDLRIAGKEGSMYLYRDIEITKNDAINGNYNIDLNKKTITGENLLISGDTESTMKNGNIVVANATISKNAKTVIGSGFSMVAENFVSSSDIEMAEDASLKVTGKFDLKDNVVFVVSGGHTLNLPARVEVASTVKIADLSKNESPTQVSSSDDFVFNMVTNTEDMTIKTANDFILATVEGIETYTLEGGYYIISQDITLDKPFTVKADEYIALNMYSNTITFTSENGIIVKGSLRLKGETVSGKTARVRGGRYTISNNGETTIDGVNVFAGNDEQSISFDYYIANGVSRDTIAIRNTTSSSIKKAKLTIVKSVIKGKIGIANSKSELNIIEANVKGTSYAVQGAGNCEINIGTAVENKDIILDGESKFTSTDTVTIGIAGKDNSKIRIAYTGNNSVIKDYTK